MWLAVWTTRSRSWARCPRTRDLKPRSRHRNSPATFAAVLLGWSASACTGTRAAPAEHTTPSPALASTTRDLPALEMWRIEYALRSAERLRTHWSQFAATDPCILFVAAEAQWVLNCTTAPEEFVGSQQRFRDRPVFVRVGGRFATRGQSLDSSAFIRAVPATIALPSPGQSKSMLAQERPFLLISALDALKRLHPDFGSQPFLLVVWSGLGTRNCKPCARAGGAVDARAGARGENSPTAGADSPRALGFKRRARPIRRFFLETARSAPAARGSRDRRATAAVSSTS
jgi:hypothetical protein